VNIKALCRQCGRQFRFAGEALCSKCQKAADRAARAKAEAVAQREARKARRETGRAEGVRAFPSLA
jgi:predicted amidophosphoribosyltransferase